MDVPLCGQGARATTDYSHVVWIWMQNKPLSAVNSSSAPYLQKLAAGCGLATRYASPVHRSLPNLLAATSGSTQGLTDNSLPSSFTTQSDNIFRQVREAGGTARTYVEGMAENCALSASGRYRPQHNPGIYFVGADDRAACQRDDVPFTQFGADLAAGTLPSFSFVSPDLCDSTHDCSLETGDRWLAGVLGQVAKSSAYATGSTAVIVAWDEGGDATGVRAPLLVIAPSVAAGARTAQSLDHYSLLRTTEELLGISGHLGGAAGATSFLPMFNS